MTDDLVPLGLSAVATILAIAYSYVWLPRQMRMALRQGLLSLARAVETKDAGSEGHGERVAELVVNVAREMGVKTRDRLKMEYSAFLQDIGNVQVPHALLNKTGELSAEELDTVRQHPMIGADIVEKVKYLHDIAPIVRHHHERWDGSGYPDGLKGSMIPLGARILAVCTAYSSMTRPRAYRPKMDEGEALTRIKAGAGSQYDPEVVDAFLRAMKKSGRGGSVQS